MRGFGSDSLSSSRNSPSNSRSGGKVVLVPTNYSKQDSSDEEGEEDDDAIYDQGFDVIPGSTTAKKGKKGGFLDLDDFYADDSSPGTPAAGVEDEEEESEESEEDTEAEDSEDGSEEESGSDTGGDEIGHNGRSKVAQSETSEERERRS